METANKNKFSGIIRGCLFAILVSLIIYAFGQSYVIIQTLESSYTALNQAFTEQVALTSNYTVLYHRTEETLANVTQELDTTKGLLSQTETMLNQVKIENVSLLDQVAALQSAQQIENQVNQLKDASAKANNELISINAQMRTLDSNFTSVDKGREMLALLGQKIAEIKGRIRGIKHEAFLARKAAQDEMDRLALLNGNQGYVVKDGQIFQPQAAQSQSNPNVNINVSFFEQ